MNRSEWRELGTAFSEVYHAIETLLETAGLDEVQDHHWHEQHNLAWDKYLECERNASNIHTPCCHRPRIQTTTLDGSTERKCVNCDTALP